MAIKKILGRIPVTRDEFKSGVKYYRDNIVTYSGCAFICTEDGTTADPAIVTTDGEIICNAGWSLFAARGAAGQKGDKGDKGDTGRSMETVNTYYAITDDSAAEPDDSLFTYDALADVVISDFGEKWLWSADKIAYSDGTSIFTGKYCVGQCKSLAAVAEQYGTSTNANTVPAVFEYSYPTSLAQGCYIWTRDEITWCDGSVTYTDPQLAGYIGLDGEAGRDGDTEEYCFRQFADKDAFDTYLSTWVTGITMESKAERLAVPDGWTDHPSGVDGSQWKIEAVSQRRIIGTMYGEWSKPVIWSNWGVEGKDGDGMEYIFYLTSGETVRPALFAGSTDSYYRSDGSIVTTSDAAYQNSEFLPYEKNGTEYLQWSDDIESPTVSMKALWVATRKRRDGVWGAFSEPKFWARYAEDGKDGDSVTATVYFTNPAMDIYPSEDDPSVFDYSNANTEIVFISGGTEVYTGGMHSFNFPGYTPVQNEDGSYRFTNSDSSVVFDVRFNYGKRSTLQIVSMTVPKVKILMDMNIGKAQDSAILEAELDADGRIAVTASKFSFRYKGQNAATPNDTTAITLTSTYYNGFTTANTWWEYCVDGVWTKLPSDRATGDTLSVAYDDALWRSLNELGIRKYGEIRSDNGDLLESDYDMVTLFRLFDGTDGKDGQFTSVMFRRDTVQPAKPTSTSAVPDGWRPYMQGYADVSPAISSGSWTANGNVFTSNVIDHKGSTWSKISFTTTTANAVVVIRITASSEPNYDWGYICKLDSDYGTSSSKYLARVCGTQEQTVEITVASAGEHYIYVGYTKDNSGSKNNDNVVVEFLDSKTPLWMTSAVVSNGAAGEWSVPVRVDGTTGNASFKSIVFKRSNDTVVEAPDSSEGSYYNPVPSADTGWHDGVPSGVEQLWMSTRIFTSDGKDPQQSAWTTPQVVSDNQYMDYEFSSEGNPGVPNKETPFSNELNDKWSNTADETTIWMAMREVSNGAYATGSAWKILKIKGEDGEDGTSINIKGTVDSYEALKKLPTDELTIGDSYMVGGDLYVWDGDSWENCGQIKGEKGDTPYLHIKYSDDGGVTFTANNGETPGKYIGTYVDYDSTDSKDVNTYKPWKKWVGEDGFGYEYIFKPTNDSNAPDVPATSENVDDYVPDGWYDNAVSVSDEYPFCWMCQRKKTDGKWGAFQGSASDSTKAALWAHYGADNPYTEFRYAVNDSDTVAPALVDTDVNPNGWTVSQPEVAAGNYLWETHAIISGDGKELVEKWSTPIRKTPKDGTDGINANSSFKSIVFKRSNDTTVDPPLASEGSYANPVPTTGGWSDGVPAGSEQLWVSTRVFTSDGEAPQQDEWTTPQPASDSQYMDYEFSSADNPGTPSKDTPDGEEKNTNWSNTADETTIWMAVREVSNGAYATGSAWKLMRIKGEKGEDGTSIRIKDSVADEAALKQIPTEKLTAGDAYMVGKDLYVWDGDSWTNCGQIKGDDGKDGAKAYLHIKYSDDGGVTFTANNGETPGKYIGLRPDYDSLDSDNPGDYTWMKWVGEDGFGYEYIFMLTADSDAPDVPATSEQVDDYVPDGWDDNAGGVSETQPFCWVCHRKKVGGVWGAFKGSSTNEGKAALWAYYEKSAYTEFRYAVNESTVTAPTLVTTDLVPAGWDTVQPTVLPGYYLWETHAVISGDGKKLIQEWSTPIRKTPEKGSYTEFRYAVNGSTVAAPELVTTDLVPAGWTVTQPEVAAGYYLWETHAAISGDGKTLLQEWSTPVRKTPEDGKDGKDGSSRAAGVYFTNPVADVFPSEDDPTVMDYSDAQTEIVFMDGSTEVYFGSLTNYSFPGYTEEPQDSCIRYTRTGSSSYETVVFDLYPKTDGRSVLKLEKVGTLGKVKIVMVIAIGESTASASFEAGLDFNGRITVTANKLEFRYVGKDASEPEDKTDIVLTSEYYLGFTTDNTWWEYNLDGTWTRLPSDRRVGDTLNITYDDALWNGKNELEVRKYGRFNRYFIPGSQSPTYTTQEDYDAVVLHKFTDGTDGTDGKDAPYYEYRYAKNTSDTTPPSITKTALIPDGWDTTVPELSSTAVEYIWWTIAKISADGTSLIENWSTPLRYTPIDGKDGKDGNSPALVYCGVWSESKTYIGTPYRVDAVKYGDSYYVARVDVDGGTIPVKTLPNNKDYWNPFGSSFESVATQLLLAEEANIAGWIYRSGRMESQTTDSDGNPMAYLDGVNGKVAVKNADIEGKITATEGIIGGLTITEDSYGGKMLSGSFDEGSGNVNYLNLSPDIFELGGKYNDTIMERIRFLPYVNPDKYDVDYPFLVQMRSGKTFMFDGGNIGGLRPLTKVITGTTTVTLDKSWYHIIMTNTGHITIKLPANPESGQTYEFMRTTKYDFTLSGNGKKIFRMDAPDSGEVGITTHDACIECIRVVYDGTRWVACPYTTHGA